MRIPLCSAKAMAPAFTLKFASLHRQCMHFEQTKTIINQSSCSILTVTKKNVKGRSLVEQYCKVQFCIWRLHRELSHRFNVSKEFPRQFLHLECQSKVGDIFCETSDISILTTLNIHSRCLIHAYIIYIPKKTWILHGLKKVKIWNEHVKFWNITFEKNIFKTKFHDVKVTWKTNKVRGPCFDVPMIHAPN